MFDPGFFRFSYFDPDYFWSKIAVAFVASIKPYDPYAVLLAQAQALNAIENGGSFSEADLRTPFGSIRGAAWVVEVSTDSPGASIRADRATEADFANHSVLIPQTTPYTEAD